jgi:hypothetical protein
MNSKRCHNLTAASCGVLNPTANKKIDISNSCFWAENITENNSLVSALRPQYVKTGANPNNMNAIDWSKINLVPDVAELDASRKYSGILTADYNNGVLTINGVLTLP